MSTAAWVVMLVLVVGLWVCVYAFLLWCLLVVALWLAIPHEDWRMET